LEFKLKVSEAEAARLLEEVTGSEFKKGYAKNWIVEDGVAYYSSVCWLFTWTQIEENTKGTLPVIDKVFNEIFEFTCEDFEKEVGLKRADKHANRKFQYDPKKVPRKHGK